MKLSFVLEKETKGAVRYQEVDEAGNPKDKGYLMGTVYLRKDALIAEAFSSDRFPQAFTLELEFDRG